MFDISLLDYDADTQTLTVSGSGASLQNIYTVLFTATLKSCTESGLDGQLSYSELELHALQYLFNQDSRAYLIGADPISWFLTTISVWPVDLINPPLTFTYSAVESGTVALPSDWVVFDGAYEFTISSSDSSLALTKTIELTATANESGQDITKSIEITLYRLIGLEIIDRIYYVDGISNATFELPSASTEPALQTASVSPLNLHP